MLGARKINGNTAPKDSFGEFQRAKKMIEEKYVLRLYISGMTSRSTQAIENLKRICEEQLHGCYDLEVIDITQQPDLVEKADVVATPTLIKELPKPIRKIIGDLSDTERILIALKLKPKK